MLASPTKGVSALGPKPFFATPVKPQWSGMPTTWTVLPSQISGAMRFVTTALARTEPRFDHTRTQPPLLDALLLGELLRNLDEELRLQHGVDPDVLGPVVEMLGQPVEVAA